MDESNLSKEETQADKNGNRAPPPSIWTVGKDGRGCYTSPFPNNIPRDSNIQISQHLISNLSKEETQADKNATPRPRRKIRP